MPFDFSYDVDAECANFDRFFVEREIPAKAAGETSFLLANVHIYYGDEEDDDPARYNNRVAEVFFLADWARKQPKLADTTDLYESNILLLGDMNVPKMSSDDPVYRALKRRGMQPSKYSTEAGTTIQEFNTYDQIVFTNEALAPVEINGRPAKFAVSDHRPLFVRLKV
jgi:hypothetical protein